MWFIGVEVDQETSAPPPKKNPGSAPVVISYCCAADINELRLNHDSTLGLTKRKRPG